MHSRRHFLLSTAAITSYLAIGSRRARAANAPGVTDTDIKIGQTMAYSGPASAYGEIGRTEAAYFHMVNDMGGINGRKVNFISLDDAYSPPNTVQQTRRLVEQEHVAFIFGSVGTACNASVHEYLNENKVPQLFIATGASMFSDPEHHPWTMAFNPSYRTEGRVFAKHILASQPDAKIGIIYQNDDLGRDYVTGLHEGLGPDHAAMIVKELSYEASDSTLDSQVITLQGGGVDTLILASTPKFAAQALRKITDLNWTPVSYVGSPANAVVRVVSPDKTKGIITNFYGKDPADPRWANDPEYKDWATFIAKYMTPNDLTEGLAVYGYGAAGLMVHVLKQCGNDLSRDNIMHQAANIKDYHGPMGLPGAMVNTSPTDYRVGRQLQLARFNGTSWEWFGDILND